MRALILLGLIGIFGLFVGCATESSRALPSPSVAAAATPYGGQKVSVTLGSFANRSGYQQGIFSDGTDRIGSQARTILEGHLQSSQRFTVLNRSEMETLANEARLSGAEQSIRGARYAVTGAVTEFGRRTVGDVQLFGLAGRGKEQVAYARVILNLVDVQSSEIVFSASGAGEFSLENRQVLGTGGEASYDAALTDKVLDLAIREAVDALSIGVDQKRFPLN